ncbi:hypothetical protein LDENG_00267280 [Lucifuga dentata]|nr:hypothetical protein LDENG_00267280 [Lucifuga dentata]
MRCLICGPKLAGCGLVLSAWGIIMLAMLGIFFSTHSAMLIEDVPITEDDKKDLNPPQNVYHLYNTISYNCFIAAALYMMLGAFCCCQMRLNKQKVIPSCHSVL